MILNNKKVRKAVITILFIIIRPFIVPILILAIFISFIGSITDILYLAFKNEDKIDMSKEIKYYTEDEYDKDEMKGFFASVWDFIDKIFGREIAEDTDWPVVGYTNITSPYGYRNAPTAGASTFHTGIDIGAPEGAKLVCIMDGEVQALGWGGGNGYTITIKSTDGKYVFSYCHSSPEFIVSVGQPVKKGEIIGKVGPKNVYGIANNPYIDADGKPTNGATTGCHCHFMVRKDGELINPLDILNNKNEQEVLIA